MSDRQREMFYDAFQDLYDSPTYTEILADLKTSLAAEKAAGKSSCPWLTLAESQAETEGQIVYFERKIASGILTAVEDLRLEIAEQERRSAEAQDLLESKS